MEEFATKTLAEIYLDQGDLQKAYDIYKILSARNPSDPEIQKRLIHLERRLGLSPSSTPPLVLSREEKIKLLNQWLHHILKRKKR